MRIAAGIEYDGGAYCGWQMQRGVPTVQERVEAAFATVADRPVRVVCAGRTDTGVHAVGQVIHFDTDAVRSARSWVLGANANLPRDVVVRWAQEVDPAFHARFRATARSYRYVILNRRVRPAVLAGRVTWQLHPLDVGRMRQAARQLVGEHDFSTFRALQCQAASPVREIQDMVVSRGGDFVYIDVRANAFLHHMVRNMAGVLMTIGRGEQPPDWVADLLALRDRTRGGVTAPPEGLYLVEVLYADRYGLPAGTAPPVFG